MKRFDVVDVSDWTAVSQELGGEDAKQWIARHEDAVGESRVQWWVYKPVKRGVTSAYRHHDDRAERIANALAALIGLPAADVELARRGQTEGIISRNVTPDGWDEQAGDVILSEIPGYLSCATDRPKNRIGHNLGNIRHVLLGVLGPPGQREEWPAFDVFVGYLLFDAWIANTDRHARNWAILSRGDDKRLAASFDHGSALASGSTDEKLERVDPSRFCCRGMASRFEGGHSVTLVDLARDAVTTAGPLAQRWLSALDAVDGRSVQQILFAVPDMSEVRRNFLEAVLAENRRRLLA